ncbi:unnamed protein product [Caenorhabditis bovis]|uniref:Paired domain-containing protein n=1 Tax=Caenorhabditis bovis TaxID=2654633 RepID=A0A8S1EYR8_9PELO|nr:unnamed protein product [Caenorhabditis bovis]
MHTSHQMMPPSATNNINSMPPLPPPPPHHHLPYSLLNAFYSMSAASPSGIRQHEFNEGGVKTKTARAYNPGRPLCIEDRRKIVRLYEEGNRVSHIARLIGVTHSCVSKIMSRYRRTGSVQPRSFRAYDYEEPQRFEILDDKEKTRIEKASPNQALPFSIERSAV